MPTIEELQSLSTAHIMFLILATIGNIFLVRRLILDLIILMRPQLYFRFAMMQISKVIRRKSIVRNYEKSHKPACNTL